MLSTLIKIPFLRFKYKFLPNKAQVFWAQELLNSQGLSAKIGQVLAQGKPTELPKSSISAKEAAQLFKKNFNTQVEIENEALAASMGQVFFARIEGSDYALKILHPGIRDKLQKEIENILTLGGYFAKTKGFQFNRSLFQSFLVEVFEQETDLNREALFQGQFHRIFAADERFKIPKVFGPLSNEIILSQEKIDCCLARDAETFKHHHIFTFFLEALLNHGVLHGDLNDRNWGINSSDQCVVYDYGCCQIISERRILGLKKLLRNEDVKNAFLEFGIRLESTSFKNREQELRDALFGPLLNQDITSELNYSQSLQAQFGEEIKKLRELTDPWILLFMRSLFSLIRIYQSKSVPIPLNSLIQSYLTLKEGPMSATQIKIEVLENKKMVVALGLPMSSLENLKDLMPPKVAQTLDSQSINFEAIIQKVINSGYAPQELFSLVAGDRSYRIWIE